MSSTDPASPGQERSGDRGPRRPATQRGRLSLSSKQTGDPQHSWNRPGEYSAGARDPAAGATFQGIKIGLRTTFNAQPFESLKNSRAQPEGLQCAALAVSHQLENAHCRADSRSRKVERKIASVAIPYRNCCGTEE